MRLSLYLFNIVSAIGWTTDRPFVILLTVLAAVGDVVIAKAMVRTASPLFRVRIPVDFIYVAAAAAAVPAQWPYSGVLLLLVPVAIELIATKGLLIGLLYLAALEFELYLARTILGSEAFPFELLLYGTWLLVVGVLAFGVLETITRQHMRRLADEEDAYHSYIRLEARNEVLLAEGGAVSEALNMVWAHIALAGNENARHFRDLYRQRQEVLSFETRQHARYLRDVLLDISAAQRHYVAKVAEQLHLRVGRRDGLTVLTPLQAETLSRQILVAGLRGRYEARIVSCDTVTGRLELDIGGRTIRVPATNGRTLSLFRAAVVFGGLSLIALINPVYAALPIEPVLAVIAAILFFGLLADWTIRRDIAVASVLGPGIVGVMPAWLTFLVVEEYGASWSLSDGRPFLPVTVGITSSVYILGVLWGQWGWLGRVLSCISIAIVTSWATVLSPVPPPPLRSIVADLLIPLGVVVAVVLFDRQNRSVGQEIHAEFVADVRGLAARLRPLFLRQEADALSQQIHHARYEAETLGQSSTRKIVVNLLEDADRFMVMLDSTVEGVGVEP